MVSRVWSYKGERKDEKESAAGGLFDFEELR